MESSYIKKMWADDDMTDEEIAAGIPEDIIEEYAPLLDSIA